MPLYNKYSIIRVIFYIFIVALLIFPFESAGINFPNLFINELIVVNVKYIIVALLFLIVVMINFFISLKLKKANQISFIAQKLDDTSDQLLINTILIILASQGFIHPIIPVIVIIIDNIINTLKTIAISKDKELHKNNIVKIKNVLLVSGIFLTLIYNLPFELLNLKVSDIIFVIATVLDTISCIQYYTENKKILMQK